MHYQRHGEISYEPRSDYELIIISYTATHIHTTYIHTWGSYTATYFSARLSMAVDGVSAAVEIEGREAAAALVSPPAEKR